MNAMELLRSAQEKAIACGDWKTEQHMNSAISCLTEKVLDAIVWDGTNTEEVVHFVLKHDDIEEYKEFEHGYYHLRCLAFEPLDRRRVAFCVFVGIPVLFAENCHGTYLRIGREPERRNKKKDKRQKKLLEKNLGQ